MQPDFTKIPYEAPKPQATREDWAAQVKAETGKEVDELVNETTTIGRKPGNDIPRSPTLFIVATSQQGSRVCRSLLIWQHTVATTPTILA